MTDRRTFADRMTVSIPEGEVDGLRIRYYEITGLELWNLYQALRYDRGTHRGFYTKLEDTVNLNRRGNPTLWMSDTDAEKADHYPAVAQIEKTRASRVLINGLGIGMVLSAALSYRHVKHVDVVEYDERVIKLVGPHYEKDPRVTIHHADAYEQTGNWHRGARWDVVWSDIWEEIDADNLPGMDRLHAFYRRRSQWHGSWARDLCLKLRKNGSL